MAHRTRNQTILAELARLDSHLVDPVKSSSVLLIVLIGSLALVLCSRHLGAAAFDAVGPVFARKLAFPPAVCRSNSRMSLAVAVGSLEHSGQAGLANSMGRVIGAGES